MLSLVLPALLLLVLDSSLLHRRDQAVLGRPECMHTLSSEMLGSSSAVEWRCCAIADFSTRRRCFWRDVPNVKPCSFVMAPLAARFTGALQNVPFRLAVRTPLLLARPRFLNLHTPFKAGVFAMASSQTEAAAKLNKDTPEDKWKEILGAEEVSITQAD